METITEATEATATEAFNTVKNIQGESSNPNKVIIRNAIKKQVMAFAKHQKNMVMVSLPATDWIIERELADDCNDNNINNYFVGVENDKNIFPMVKNNKPKGESFRTCLGDFDNLIKSRIKKGFNEGETIPNVFWADYCGNFSNPSNGYGERYPHLNTFFYAAKTLKTPFLYYMTFSLMARHSSGRKGLSAVQYAWRLKQAIQIRYQQMIDRGEISRCIVPIFSSVYRGAGISDMITIGFAVNTFRPSDKALSSGLIPFDSFWYKTNNLHTLSDGICLMGVNRNLLSENTKPSKVAKAIKVEAPANTKKVEKIEEKNLRKIAIKLLYDSELFSNAEISTVLGLSRNQVGAILAHHCHPESFNK